METGGQTLRVAGDGVPELSHAAVHRTLPQAYGGLAEQGVARLREEERRGKGERRGG